MPFNGKHLLLLLAIAVALFLDPPAASDERTSGTAHPSDAVHRIGVFAKAG